MSDMRPPTQDAWMPLEHAKASGMVVTLVEDLLDGEPEPRLHTVFAPATQAMPCSYIDQTLPSVLLANGAVVVLSWEQMRAVATPLSNGTGDQSETRLPAMKMRWLARRDSTHEVRHLARRHIGASTLDVAHGVELLEKRLGFTASARQLSRVRWPSLSVLGTANRC